MIAAGDRVTRSPATYVNSCGCAGCHRGHNDGSVLSVDEARGTALVRFVFGTEETVDLSALKKLDAVSALGRIG